MKNLKELEKKYEELGKEIEKLKKEEQEQENIISKDPIFLLSIEEYEKYKDKIPFINTCWWLRTPPNPNVDDNGVMNTDKNVDDNSIAVRPALRIDPKEWFFKKDESRIVFCGVTWIQIDNGLYIAEMPIAFRQFDKKSDDYTKSEIRKFLLDWYEERIDY